MDEGIFGMYYTRMRTGPYYSALLNWLDNKINKNEWSIEAKL